LMNDFFVVLLAILLGITTIEMPVSPPSKPGGEGGQAGGRGVRREALGIRLQGSSRRALRA
jgi:hypothetical protein